MNKVIIISTFVLFAGMLSTAALAGDRDSFPRSRCASHPSGREIICTDYRGSGRVGGEPIVK